MPHRLVDLVDEVAGPSAVARDDLAADDEGVRGAEVLLGTDSVNERPAAP